MEEFEDEENVHVGEEVEIDLSEVEGKDGGVEIGMHAHGIYKI